MGLLDITALLGASLIKLNFLALPTYRVEAAKTTLAPLVAKFGVKAGGDYNANRTVPLVFWGLLVPACQMV